MIQKIKSLIIKPAKPSWIVLAEHEIGTHEVRGGENPRILEYHSATALHATEDEIAWCSSFVNWCMMKCGYERSHQANARSWLGYGTTLKSFKKYAIVIFKRGNNNWQGHVSFAIEDDGERIKCLGGNQSNAVRYSYYRRSDVIGYRWPVKES